MALSGAWGLTVKRLTLSSRGEVAFPVLISNDVQLGTPAGFYCTQIQLSCSEVCHADESNPVQPGLSMPEFLNRDGTEPSCEAALEHARWPAEFRCRRCDGVTYSRARGRAHALFQCQACRHQTSLIAGTVMQGTKLPLTTWF